MKSREIAAYAVALIALIVGGVAVVRGDGDSAVVAAWVQALGSVAAIIVVSLPVLIQRSIDLQQAKAATLATVNSAYDVMTTLADSYLGQGKERSEWYVCHLPSARLDILDRLDLAEHALVRGGAGASTDRSHVARDHLPRTDHHPCEVRAVEQLLLLCVLL